MSLSMLEHRWYTVQTTSGHENKVLRLIQRKIDMDPATPEDRLIRQALVPTQEVVEIKNGKKVTVERKIFPGYVLVEMVASQDTLHEGTRIRPRTRRRVRRFLSLLGRRWRSRKVRSPTSTGRSKRSCPTRARSGCQSACSAGPPVWNSTTCSYAGTEFFAGRRHHSTRNKVVARPQRRMVRPRNLR